MVWCHLKVICRDMVVTCDIWCDVRDVDTIWYDMNVMGYQSDLTCHMSDIL